MIICGSKTKKKKDFAVYVLDGVKLYNELYNEMCKADRALPNSPYPIFQSCFLPFLASRMLLSGIAFEASQVFDPV